MNDSNPFRDLGLSEPLMAALASKGFEEPTPIQRKVIPLFLDGDKDIIGQAQTGTGKTAAFGLPVIEALAVRGVDLEAARARLPRALILAPTRELAVQVSEEISSLKGDLPLRVFPVYGGQSIGLQIKRLKEGVDVVVGTPGRVIDHIERMTLDLSAVRFLVLDEADEMLDMGFAEDVERILESVNQERRMLLFSATMPERILSMARRFMGTYTHVSVESPAMTTSLTEQMYFEVREQDKFEALCRIIDMEDDFYGLVFCRTKVLTTELTAHLSARGYEAEALSGDVGQQQREETLSRFKDRRITILCATDVAARGIDVNELTHVINFSLPSDPESYVHRIGRTGRAGREGMAITFITPDEYRKLMYIRRTTNADIRRESLPGIDAVIESRKARILSSIKKTVEGEDWMRMSAMASDLVANDTDPERVIASLLHMGYGKVLDRSRYREIREPQRPQQRDFGPGARGNFRDGGGTGGGGFRDRAPFREGGPRESGYREGGFRESGGYRDLPDAAGTTRVFLRLGRKDGYDKFMVMDYVQKQGGIEKRHIGAVKVFDLFSLIQLPFAEAENMIKRLSRAGKGRGFVKIDEGKKERADYGDRPPRDEHAERGDGGPAAPREHGDRPKRDYKRKDKHGGSDGAPGADQSQT